jgi:hypothetical protein
LAAEVEAISSATASAWDKSIFPLLESPAGEFAWFGQAATGFNQDADDFLLDVGRTMATDFHTVFAGIGMRSPEKGGNHLVNQVAIPLKLAQVNGMGRLLG